MYSFLEGCDQGRRIVIKRSPDVTFSSLALDIIQRINTPFTLRNHRLRNQFANSDFKFEQEQMQRLDEYLIN